MQKPDQAAALAQNPAKRPRRRRWIILAVLAVLVLLAAMALRGGKQAAAPEPEAAPAEFTMQLLPSELHKVVRGRLRDTVQLTGSLVPEQELTVAAEVSGRVQSVNVREGQAVAQGDELVTIDVEALSNQLEQQQATAQATLAQLDLARAQLRRTTDLVRRGVTSSSSLETETANVAQLEANYAALMKQVASAEDDLSKARITAPFDGIISARSVNPGGFVSPGSELLELVDISELVLEGGIPVNYGPRLRVGQDVTVRVDGIAERRFDGKINRIAPVAVSGTRVLPVYAAIDNADGVLKGGMFATGDLVLEETADGIGIPAPALRHEDETSYVLLLEGDRVVRRDVQVARSWSRGRTIEIASGLAEGDVIVSQPLERLRDGARVKRVGD
ncbi:efflux RND transporter periplasmic adaptor subunit [Paracoccus laeviglucosivorans]|uniref:RND family efflux transporter, MFP subunit n=1 Tax=Paracoccus laeviglucosivorans TaxID=1197861 RepID=A0A521F0A1_9RHOB|nr:efflux RND transporter periplasmic adaptor subunit [Paracoccus laeviglucosivorans]SMO89506.1 RND family efflux transporter, MFP subunit [Paracoccus laeviglucosivorans]